LYLTRLATSLPEVVVRKSLRGEGVLLSPFSSTAYTWARSSAFSFPSTPWLSSHQQGKKRDKIINSKDYSTVTTGFNGIAGNQGLIRRR